MFWKSLYILVIIKFNDNDKNKFIDELITNGGKIQIEIRPRLKILQMLTLNYDWYIADNHIDTKLIISDDLVCMFWLRFYDINFSISLTQVVIFKLKD